MTSLPVERSQRISSSARGPDERPPPGSRLTRARDQARRVGDWAGERVPGADLVAAALERERLAAAGLLAGGLAYRLFFWLVPLGLVLASVLSFWVDEDRVGLQDAARNFGISGAATQSAMKAIAEEHHARWYFLLAGIVLLVWFGIGVIRALNVAHAVAWSLRPEKLRRPLFAGLAFSGIVIALIAVSASTQLLREEYGVTGLWVTIALVVFYLVAVLWIMDKLPHRSTSWRDLLPGALLVALGTEVIHLVVVLYLVPKLGHSSELYGALGSATVILLWLYLLARLLVAAAFLNAALWDRRTDGEPVAP